MKNLILPKEYCAKLTLRETQRAIKIIKDNEIRCSFNEFSEEVEQEWRGWSFLINDVKVTLPSKTDLFVVEIKISDAVEE